MLFRSSSDVRRERIWHIALPALLAAATFTAASIARNDLVALAAFALAIIPVLCIGPLLYSLASSLLRGPAAAGAIALVNTIGSVGGFLGPTLMGALKSEDGSYAAGMTAIAVAMLACAVTILVLGRAMAPHVAPAKAGGT